MDTGRTFIFTGGLKLASETAIDENGLLGTRRGWKNIRWYEYTFLVLGILAVLATDGLTIARLIDVGSFKDTDFAYGCLLIVHSVFLLLFLITGIFYQRITDIVAFSISAVLLTVYVIAHYFTRKNSPQDRNSAQSKIRLARLILTIAFNVIFIPLVVFVIKLYRRDEFSKRLFGAFPTARYPLKIYSIFDCIARINTMLSISSLLLNLYNYTGYETLDKVFLIIGIPVTLLWLGMGIGMARLESPFLFLAFVILSLFQFGFLIFGFVTAIQYTIKVSSGGSTGSITTTASTVTTNIVPILPVLYVCISLNFLLHLLSVIFGWLCKRNFDQGLKDKVFNSPMDKWLQTRWSKN